MNAPTTSSGPHALATRLELTFRLLKKRIYLPSLRHVGDLSPGLDHASVPLLAALEDRGECRPSDVAAAVELDLSTVSRQVRQLEQLGLVSRRQDSEDRRAFRISLTSAGHDRLSSVRANHARLLEEVFGEWSSGQRRDFLHQLDRLLDGLSALSTTPCTTTNSSHPSSTEPTSSDPNSSDPNKESRP